LSILAIEETKAAKKRRTPNCSIFDF